jgi:hypothetical protein
MTPISAETADEQIVRKILVKPKKKKTTRPASEENHPLVVKLPRPEDAVSIF